MNTQQINTIIKSDKITKKYYLGTFPADRLPAPQSMPFCFIANTHTSDKGGEHWIAIYCDANGHGSYIDSYGHIPRKEFTTYLKKYCISHNYNSKGIQGVLSSTCGCYAIYYCLMLTRGYELNKITDRFNLTHRVDNDIIITAFIEEVFDTSFPIYDNTFLLNQVCTALKENDI